MIAWYWLFIPGMMGLLNRDWRGEGDTPIGRWFWYVFNALVALAVAFPDFIFSGAWALFAVGYSMVGWHAMFSAITRRPPGRMDSAYYDWMQKLTYRLLSMKRPPYVPGFDNEGKRINALDRNYVSPYSPLKWAQFGAWYGMLRGTLMLPGVAAMFFYTGSAVTLAGVGMLGMGWVYYWAAKIRDHFELREDYGVPIAEFIMGWLCGTYLLICASQLS